MSKFHRLNTKSAILTPQKVLEMRKDYAHGLTQGGCAQKYGVSVGQVGRIVRNEAWMQVPSVPTDGDIELTAILDGEQRKAAPTLILSDPEGSEIAKSILRTKALLNEGGDSKEVRVGRGIPNTCPGCGKKFPEECDWCSDVVPRPMIDQLGEEPSDAT